MGLEEKVAPPQGIKALHYGFRKNDMYFPLSEFAMAWIGTSNKNELEEAIDEQIEKYQEGILSEEETPMLYEAIEKAVSEKEKNPLLKTSKIIMDEMRGMAKKVYGTTKMIDEEAVKIKDAEKAGTKSPYWTVSMTVATRESKRKKGIKDHEVTLYNPFIKKSEDIKNFWFKGGTLHAQKNSGKNNHWTNTLKQDQGFIERLEKIIERERNKNPEFPITPEDVRNDYYKQIDIVDYAIACALTELAKSGRKTPSRIKGAPIEKEEPLLPFDFNNSKHLALEAFYMAHKTKGKKATKKLVESRLFSVDMYLSGKKGIVTRQANKLFREGYFTKEAVKDTRKFNDYSWAIIQALEEHMHKKKRRFKGYGVEFPKTDNQTISIVFENAVKEKDQVHDYDVRIIYDSNVGLPYIMYKTKINVKPRTLKEEEDFRKGLKVHPLTKVNPPKEYDTGRPSVGWKEIDPRTGNIAIYNIFKPTWDILMRASQISKQTGRGIMAKELKKRYDSNTPEDTYKAKTRKRA